MPSIATQTTTFLAECPRVLENKKVLKPTFFKRMKQIHERALVKGKKDPVKEFKNNKEIMNFMKIMTSLAIEDMRVKAKAEKKALKEAKKAKKELDEKDAKLEREAQKVEAKVQKKAEKVVVNVLEKVVEKVSKKAEKEAKKAEKEAKKAEKEAKKAEKEREMEALKARKRHEKAAQKLEKAAGKKVVKKIQNKEKRFYIDDLADIRPPTGMFVTTDAFGNRFDMHDM